MARRELPLSEAMQRYRAAGSMEFAKQLPIHAKMYEHRIRQAARKVKKFLSMRTSEPA
jgi:hypothetical protein